MWLRRRRRDAATEKMCDGLLRTQNRGAAARIAAAQRPLQLAKLSIFEVCVCAVLLALVGSVGYRDCAMCLRFSTLMCRQQRGVSMVSGCDTSG